MIKAGLYKLLFGFITLISLLPFWILHRISDALYVLIYYILGYRKKLVLSSLKESFPEKSDTEIKKIQKQFYHHLADLVIESVKSSTMNQKQFRARYHVTNWNKLREVLSTGESVIIVSPHTGNWEWVFSLVDRIPCTVLAIYQKLNNPYMDNYIKKTRQRYGAVMVSRGDIIARIEEAIKNKEQILSWFAADQACPPEKAHWAKFLGQDTTFHKGYENIARETGQRVLFLDIRKKKRSFYELEFRSICENPSDVKEGSIIEEFARLTERRIRKDPAYWLWSHNRWKHRKVENKNHKSQKASIK